MVKPFITQKFFTDGSHGWLKVRKSRLVKLGIENKITHYSYMKGDFAYLEEDCDLSTYIHALLKQEGVADLSAEYKVFMREFWNRTETCYSEKRSKIRSYDNYEVMTPELEDKLEKIRERMYGVSHWGRKALRRIKNAGKNDLLYWNEYYGMNL